ncbi:trimeric intracellular cation channel family protein [Alsobacter sp. SYSU BS001988]
MTFNTAAAVLDWLGVIVFAISGALVGSRKQMDIVGFALMGTVTGVGGGSIRDVLLGTSPVFWVQEPAYLVVCVLVSASVFFAAHLPQSRYRLLLWFDAVGLALFAVTGAERALLAEAGATAAVVMGVITATFGGVIRDVLGAEMPVVLSREVYVTAALCGAALFVAMSLAGLPREISILLGFGAGLLVRGAALHWGWSLPRYRGRPGRTLEEIKRLD